MLEFMMPPILVLCLGCSPGRGAKCPWADNNTSLDRLPGPCSVTQDVGQRTDPKPGAIA
jgi:hypothetical protein